MEHAPRQRKGIASATIVQAITLVAVGSAACMVAAFAADPAWWTLPGTGTRSAVVAQQVVTNDGVVSTNYVRNDYAVVTQGQLKQFTVRAVDELNDGLPSGAGPVLNAMVSNWAADYATNGYSASHPKPSDYTAMTVGQLKYVAGLVDSQLSLAGYAGLTPSWLQVNTNTDNALANVGQLKEAFDFDLSVAPQPITNFFVTIPSEGEMDLSWSAPAQNNNATLLTLEQSTDGGATWTAVGLLPANETNFIATNLGTGSNYSYRVTSANSQGSSSQAINPGSATPPPPSPTPTANVDGSGDAVLSWTAVTGATSYKVEREALATGTWSELDTTTDTTYTDINSGDGGHHYRITAIVNGSVKSSVSGEYPTSSYIVIPLDVDDPDAPLLPIAFNNHGNVLLASGSDPSVWKFWTHGARGTVGLDAAYGMNNND